MKGWKAKDKDDTTSKTIVHLVDSSSRYETANTYQDTPDRLFVRTPRANANFLSLRDFNAQKLVAYRACMKTLCCQSSDVFLCRSRERGYMVENNNVYIRGRKGRMVDL